AGADKLGCRILGPRPDSTSNDRLVRLPMTIARIAPQNVPLSGIVDPPSSKNYTLRYVLTACLAHGRSIVRRPAIQDDAVALVRCLRQLGARIVGRTAAGEETEFSIRNAATVDHLDIHGFGSEPSLP